jgi:hypothetical protein
VGKSSPQSDPSVAPSEPFARFGSTRTVSTFSASVFSHPVTHDRRSSDSRFTTHDPHIGSFNIFTPVPSSTDVGGGAGSGRASGKAGSDKEID